MKKIFLMLVLFFASQNHAQDSLALQVLDKVTEVSIGTAAVFCTLATIMAGRITYESIQSYYADQELIEKCRLAGKENDPAYENIMTPGDHFVAPRALGTALIAGGAILFWYTFKQLVTVK